MVVCTEATCTPWYSGLRSWHTPGKVCVFQVVSFPQVSPLEPHMHLTTPLYMPCQFQSPWSDHPNQILWGVQIIIVIMWSPAVLYYLIHLRHTYLPQHPVLELLQSIFLPVYKRPIVTPIKNIQNKSSLYFIVCIFGEQTRWQKMLDQMVPGIPWDQSYLNFIMNAILNC
jgi:hypothetical protein